MIEAMARAPLAHVVGGGAVHWADIATALLVSVAVVGLTLVASGRRVRARAARDRPARPLDGRQFLQS